MNFISLFLQPSGSSGIGSVGSAGIFLAIAVVLIIAASAFFSFVMLRKTVKMAIRLIILGIILLIAIVGSVSFYWFSSGNGDDSPKPRPTNSRSR